MEFAGSLVCKWNKELLVCLTCVCVAVVEWRRGGACGVVSVCEWHRELRAQQLQSLLLHGQGSDLLLQTSILHLQLVQRLQNGQHCEYAHTIFSTLTKYDNRLDTIKRSI